MNLFAANRFAALQKALDGLNKRHEAIANNIANVDTPGYKQKTVSFREELNNAMKEKKQLAVTDKQHISLTSKSISSVQPQVHIEENTAIRNDKNNVSIDAEMAQLAKNTLGYKTISKQLNNQFSRLKLAIRKGGQT